MARQPCRRDRYHNSDGLLDQSRGRLGRERRGVGIRAIDGGQDLSQSIGGGIGDAIGFTSVYGAFTNTDAFTHQDLGWSIDQRVLNGVFGAIQLGGGIAAGAGDILSSGGPMIGNGLSAGAQYLGQLRATAADGVAMLGAAAGWAPGLAAAGVAAGEWGGTLSGLGARPWQLGGFANALFSVKGDAEENSMPMRADGEVPLGTEFNPESHNMVASLYREGNLISQRQFVSGNLSAKELELAQQQGLAEPWRIGDTENRALRAMDLQAGDTLVFDGQFAPCESCQSAMINRAMETGAEVQYRFLDSAGNVRIWSAQQRGYIYAGF